MARSNSTTVSIFHAGNSLLREINFQNYGSSWMNSYLYCNKKNKNNKTVAFYQLFDTIRIYKNNFCIVEQNVLSLLFLIQQQNNLINI